MPNRDDEALARVEKLLREMTGEKLKLFDQGQAEKLAALVDGIHPEDITRIHRAVVAMRGLDAIGGIGSWLIRLGAWVAGIIAVIALARGWLQESLHSLLGLQK